MLRKLMIKKEKISKDNIVKFPSKLTDLEKEIEALIFAAAEPLEGYGVAGHVGCVCGSLRPLGNAVC